MKRVFEFWLGGWFYVTTTTLIVSALVASAVGTGVAAYSSYEAGQAQKKLAEYNAQLADQNAQATRRDALIQANAARAQNAKILAAQRARFAANGVTLDTGSPLLTEAEQAGKLELGALNTEYSGNNQAARYTQQGIMDRMQGSAAARAGTLNAAGSILQGVGSMAGTAAGARYQGMI